MSSGVEGERKGRDLELPLKDGHRVRCPRCGFIGTLDDFDVMLCDEGDLICNHCYFVGVMEDGESEE